MLFRHKWKLLILPTLGLLTAMAQFRQMPHTYESQAKLLVKYVVETRSPSQIGASFGINNVDESESVMNTEIEILTSLDLAKRVAAGLAAEKRSQLTGGNTNDMAAAMVIQEGVRPELPNRGKVIQVGFRHSDKEVVQPVLEGVIREYKNMHESTHRPKSELEADLRSQLDQLKSSLNESEERLRQAKTHVGIVSLEESKKQSYAELSRIRQQLSGAEVDLAGHKALLSQGSSLLAGCAAPGASTPTKGTEGASDALRTELQMEPARIAAVESRILKLKEQLEMGAKTAGAIEAIENDITQLERRKRLDEENYMRLAISLDQVKLDKALNASGNVYNLTTIQEPSPAMRIASSCFATSAKIFFSSVFLALCGVVVGEWSDRHRRTIGAHPERSTVHQEESKVLDPDVKKMLDWRLAEGQISTEQYQQILAVLTPKEKNRSTEPAEPDQVRLVPAEAVLTAQAP